MKQIVKTKKNLSLIIIAFLLVTIFSIWYFFPSFSNDVTSTAWDKTVSTAFSGGNGSLENPYLINSGSDLAYLKELLEGSENEIYSSKHYKLTNDINLGNHEFKVNNTLSFSGSINGDAYTIYNANIMNGLFSSLEEASIKNINFKNITITNSEETVAAVIAHNSINSTFENITLNINYNVEVDNYGGILLGIDQNSLIKNIIIDVNYNNSNNLENKIGNILYKGTGTKLENILIKKNDNNNIVLVNENIVSTNILEYTVNNNEIIIENNKISQVLESLIDSEDYTYKIQNGSIIFAKKVVELSSTNMGMLAIPSFNFEIRSSGISGDTLYINDLEADWNYYYGLNYTTSSTGLLPAGINQNIYNESNLVRVQISYSGTDPVGNLTGYVSLTELQSKYVYYHYYPVVNGKVKIDLIDNPFTNRPNDKGFNGWVLDTEGFITFDSSYYKRFVEVDVNYTGGIPDDLAISLHASWVEATVFNITTAITQANWSTVFSPLKAKTMTAINITERIYEAGFDMGKTASPYYYYQVIVPRYSSQAGYYNATEVMQSGTCNTNPSCTLYERILPGEGHYFNVNNTYYQRSGSSMAVVNPNNITGLTYYDRVAEPFSGHSMAGYYVQKVVPRYDSIVGYYDASGVLQTSGTCNTSSGCILYELLQSYDSFGIEPIANITTTYYYLVTRDTNIAVMRANVTTSWTTAVQGTKPFTLTSVYNGVDYRGTYLWSVASANVQINTDTTIENMRINSNQSNAVTSSPTPTTAASTNRYLYGNFKNLKLGRGIYTGTTNTVAFYGIFGGSTGASGSTTTPTKYNLIIESGSTIWIVLTNITGTSNLYLDMYGTYGSDYDRITGNNSGLDVRFVATGSWGGNLRAANNVAVPMKLTVKSGSFGTSQFDHTTGLYVGGRGGGTHYCARSAKIEGGWIRNLIGGPLSDTSRRTLNDIYIYQTGGEVDLLIGGAGTSATYGNRVLSLTGGRVNYSVFGGSNSYNGASTDGTLNGSSFVYVGGNYQVGNQTLVNNNSTLFNAQAGSVFGIGNGQSGTSYVNLGSMDNSNIIIDGNAHVLRNVYGGGNYGSVGIVSSSATNVTNVTVLDGVIEGDVYGAGNQNGAGNSTHISTINVTVNGGLIKGSVYGGANITGTVTGTTNVNILTGEILNNVYGGGKGGTAAANFVARDVKVVIGSSTQSPIIRGSVYGGSAFGSVNGTTNNTNVTAYTTNVTVNSGVIEKSVFGGGEGNTTYTPYILGNLTVNINGGSIGYVYGGNDQAGTPNGTSPVYLTGGTIGEAYGGGNRSSVRNTQIYLQGANTTYLYGGSNASGTVTSTTVNVTSGTVGYVFGGNNVGGTCATTTVNINGGTITNEIYGGGNLISTTTTNLNLNNADNLVPYAFGGGKSANVTTANVNKNNATVLNLYGGSNTSGLVQRSNLNYNRGNAGNVYGGNNEGGETTESFITMLDGDINYLFGGGNQAVSITGNITINNGIVDNVFGGGNQAGINNTTITLNGGNITNVYGGSNASGTVTNSTITVKNANAIISKIYGGNNVGGITTNPKIIIQNGTIGDIYGGGNLASITKTNIEVSGGNINNLYGGGNQAAVTQGTNLKIIGGNFSGNIYGGGNYGTVGQNTIVNIVDTNINGSVHAGGNGQTAIVYGNTNISIGGTTNIGNDNSQAPTSGSVFGGGNAAATGEQVYNTSTATVNIAGGKIYGNVYGGANTSVVYGTTNVNIGLDSITDKTLKKGDIYIKGTIFGGGESNASGSEIYDYSFISVTKGIDIQINGNGYTNFAMTGSIFGSGNASSAQGESTITIKNYGTISNPRKNISIQRTDILTIDNSSIILSGASDRTNEYSDVPFTFSIIGNLKLRNNSNLFLETGANLLKKWESLASDGTYATVSIDNDNKSVSKNTNNRVYMLEGKNLNIATNESVTSYGEVYGMAFLGMYSYNHDGTVNMGIFSPNYNYGDTLDWGMMPSKGSYVLGLHKIDHDIEKDGFYSNYMDEETSKNIVNYVTPTPEDSDFYMWIIGEAIVEYTIDLVASKYSTLGSAELTFLEFSEPNTSFQVMGFDYSELASGISLIDSNDIPRVAASSDIANTVLGLSMKSSKSGWLTTGETKFLTSNPDIIGTTNYIGENSTSLPSMMFYLYHSKNITETDGLGTVRITVMAITKIDALTNKTQRLVINVNLSTALYQTNEYEGSMTPGREYSMFSSTVTNITSKSSISAYYSLYSEDGKIYKDGYYRALVSSYILPVNTKITMIDFVNEVPVYYYHVITESDYINAQNEYAHHNEVSYNFSMFSKMGSTNTGISHYNNEDMNNIYYIQESLITSEEFIFILDFEDTNIQSNKIGNSLLIELRDSDNQTIISVLGIQHHALVYNIYANEDGIIDVNGTSDKSVLYIGQQSSIDITTNFINSKVGGNMIFDTRYFDSKLGIKITFLDQNGQLVTGTNLIGLNFIMDGIKYYPSIDGSTRIKIADKVGNASTWLIMETENSTLASGNYTIVIEAFGSPDGIYYGSTSSDTLELPIRVINSIYGLDTTVDENATIFDAVTGKNQKGTDELKFSISYNSGLENPSIRMKLFRREYDSYYDTGYELVDFKDFANQLLISTANEKEYLIITNPHEINNLMLVLKPNMMTGTYRIDFSLYDKNEFIGKISRYIIIK